MSYQLIRGDATSIPLADDSVDLIVTSPPYFALRSYTDGGEHYDGQIGSEATPQAFLEALWAVTAECRRVLKPSGSMFVNLGDKYSGVQPAAMRNGGLGTRMSDMTSKITAKNVDFGIPAKSLMMLPQRYAIGCIDQLGLILRAEIIWSKPNGLPESVTDRVRRSHEQWFHFTKEPRYFSAVDEIREEYDAATIDRYKYAKNNTTENRGAALAGDGKIHQGPLRADLSPGHEVNPLGKLPGSVWTIPTEPLRVPDHIGVDHFAAFPSEWPRRLILGWSPSGVCVACGEGRRPVAEPTGRLVSSSTDPARQALLGGSGNKYGGRDDAGEYLRVKGGPQMAKAERTITGYACACPDTTAPTRPAVVLDPFSGTGTTAAVAHALGRHGIGIDLSADYLRLAEWRCNDPALRAKVLRVDKPKAVPDGQLDMFDGAA